MTIPLIFMKLKKKNPIMKRINLFLCCILLLSCVNKNKMHSENISECNSLKDTVIIYDIDNISSQGAEAIVHYNQSKITLCEINIYGEMGRVNLIFEFSNNQIKVTEKDYQYETEFMLVAEKDIKLVKDFSYTMNLDGIPLEEVSSERVDIFQEFKQIVSFVLN